jgi:hypothetical protein
MAFKKGALSCRVEKEKNMEITGKIQSPEKIFGGPPSSQVGGGLVCGVAYWLAGWFRRKKVAYQLR